MVQKLIGFLKKDFKKKITWMLVITIFCGSFFILLSLIGTHSYFHDEAVYLTKARSWMEGSPASEYRNYRPIGMVAWGWIFLHFGDQEATTRLFGVIFGSVALLILFILFKETYGLKISLLTTLVVGTSIVFLEQSPRFLNDIPSSGLLFAVLLCIWHNHKTEGRGNLIYLAAPLAASAFYMRYGVATSLAVISIVFFLTYVIQKRRTTKEEATKLNITFLATLVLLIPHFIHSLIEEKSFFGILLRSGKAAHAGSYIGEGLIQYLHWLPNTIGGWMLGVAAIAGIIITILSFFDPDFRKKHYSLFWLGLTALGVFVITGLLIHAETRYVFFSVSLFTGVGIGGIEALIKEKNNLLSKYFLAIFFIATCVVGVLNYQKVYTSIKSAEADLTRGVYAEVSRIIARDEENAGCAVWSALRRPQISWYSKCNTLVVGDLPRFEKDFLIHLRKSHYAIVLVRAIEPQLNKNVEEAYGISLEEIYRSKSFETFPGEVIVYKIIKTEFLADENTKLIPFDEYEFDTDQ